MTGWMHKRVVLAALGGLVAGLTVLDRFDVGLAAMHRVGDVSGGFGDLASPGSLWSPHAAQQLVRAWLDWDADRLAEGLGGRWVGPQWLVFWYAVVDALLVTVPLMLLLVAAASRAHASMDMSPRGSLDGGRPRDRAGVRARALAQILVGAVFAAGAYGMLGVLANILASVMVWTVNDPAMARAVGVVSLLKVTAFAAAAVPVLFALILASGRVWQRVKALGRELMALRAPAAVALVIALVFLALGGDLGLQIDDVVMRWIEEPLAGLVAFVATVGTAWLMVLAGEACLETFEKPPSAPDRPLSWRLLVIAAVAGSVLAVAGLVVAVVAHRSVGYLAVFPGAALAVIAALSLPRHVREMRWVDTDRAAATGGVAPGSAADDTTAARDTTAVRRVQARGLVYLLASVPIVALSLVSLRAGVTLAVTQERRASILFAVAVVLPGATAAAVRARRYRLRPTTVRARRALWLASVVAVGLASAYAMIWPLSAGARLGAVGLLFLLAAGLVLVLTGLHLWGDKWAPRGVLSLLGLRRVPLITLLVLWFVASSLLDRTGHYHDVRLGDRLSGDFRPVTVEEALQAWLTRQQGTDLAGKKHLPMLFVATAGGGIRSAYWTALAMDCLFGTRARPSGQPAEQICDHPTLDRSVVFAASGISGGSLGLVVDRTAEESGIAATSALDDDFLSATVAALAFRDLPNGLLRLEGVWEDRAAVLEHAWERAVASLAEGLFASARTLDGAPRLPLLLLNSATVDDGCRLNGSPLIAATNTTAGPKLPAGTEGCLSLTPFEPGRDQPTAATDTAALAGSTDLFDLACRQEPAPPAGSLAQPARHDVPISTVAHLSARFPYVSPMGALTSCGWPQRRTFALDGGLLESSAVSPLTELWARLAGRIHEINNNPASGYCIEPRLLMLDNGYAPAASSADANRPQELIAPVTGSSLFSTTRGARAEQAAALAFDHAFGNTACRGADGTAITPQTVAARVAHLAPTTRPGPRAPLGWSLSQFARHDLVDQLRSSANLCQIALVHSWFEPEVPAGTPRCITGFAVRDPAGTFDADERVTSLASPTPDQTGQAGVRITVQPASAAASGNDTTTSDATGRFTVLVKAGQAFQLRIAWGGATLCVPVRAAGTPLDLSVNVMVDGDGVPTGERGLLSVTSGADRKSLGGPARTCAN